MWKQDTINEVKYREEKQRHGNLRKEKAEEAGKQEQEKTMKVMEIKYQEEIQAYVYTRKRKRDESPGKVENYQNGNIVSWIW